jgi:hypothetical protein
VNKGYKIKSLSVRLRDIIVVSLHLFLFSA